jgi:hypothetical protein
LWPMPLFLLSTHKKCRLSHFIHNSTAMVKYEFTRMVLWPFCIKISPKYYKLCC